MGKFENSDIHQRYSDWHWNLVKIHPKYKRLYVADIDRLWIEYDFNKNAIVAIMDLKYSYNGIDGVTATEEGIYEHFERLNIPVYLVYIDSMFKEFRVSKFGQNKFITYDSIGYADFLLSLRSSRIKSN